MMRVAAWCGLHAGRLIAAGTLMMLLLYLGATALFPKPDHRVVFGDATHHFVQLRSIVFDHDLDFRNEYVRLYGLTGVGPGTEWIYTDLTATGHVRNYMPIGPALLWAPLYVSLAGGQALAARAGWAAPPDGFELTLQLVPGISGIIAAGLATWLSFLIARRFTTAVSAAIAALAVWLGSHALYYSVVSPSYSHAASMLTAALFVQQWLRFREQFTMRRFAVLGALAGLAALMRWQDATFIVVPIAEAVLWRAAWSRRIQAVAITSLAATSAFAPQMIVWTVLYGQPLAIPQGPSFMQWTTPHLFEVLFSPAHGLFSWAPLLMLSIAGIFWVASRFRPTIPGLLLLTLPAWYVNAAVADWWAGEAFGARRFLSLYPLFVLGLAAWLHANGRHAAQVRRVALTVVLVGANWLLLLQYELYMKGLHSVAPYPTAWFDMYVARFIVPFQLFAWWQS